MFASGFFFAKEPFLAKKASYGARGTVLSAADAGLKAVFFYVRWLEFGVFSKNE